MDLYNVFVIIMVLLVIEVVCFGIYQEIYARIGGNKTKVDMNFTFKKAITYMGNEKIELKVKSWKDYEGEQIQVVTEEGKVYLLSTYNTILVSE